MKNIHTNIVRHPQSTRSQEPGGIVVDLGPCQELVWLLGVPKDPVLFCRLYDFTLDMTLTQIHEVQTLSSHTAGAV